MRALPALVLLAALATSASAAPPTEVLEVSSRTLTDSQFLAGVAAA